KVIGEVVGPGQGGEWSPGAEVRIGAEVEGFVLREQVPAVAHEGAPHRVAVLLLAGQGVDEGRLARIASGASAVVGQGLDPLKQMSGPFVLFDLGPDLFNLVRIQQQVRMLGRGLRCGDDAEEQGEEKGEGYAKAHGGGSL